MRKLMNLMPVVALVIAATMALAFNEPTREINDPEYGFFEGQWYDVTGIEPGENTYTCELPNSICTRDDDSPSGNVEKTGTFVVHDLDPML